MRVPPTDLHTFLLRSLGGSSPFLVDSLDLTKDNIINTRLSFPAKTFRGVSESAKDLIAKLLVKEKRSVHVCQPVCLANQSRTCVYIQWSLLSVCNNISYMIIVARQCFLSVEYFSGHSIHRKI